MFTDVEGKSGRVEGVVGLYVSFPLRPCQIGSVCLCFGTVVPGTVRTPCSRVCTSSTTEDIGLITSEYRD